MWGYPMALKPPAFIRPGAPRNDKERRAAHDRTRPNAAGRGYDARWQRFTADYLRAHPTCSVLGCMQFATEVHHIKRVRDRPDLRLEHSNVTGLCRYHHSQITAREDGFARHKDKRIR